MVDVGIIVGAGMLGLLVAFIIYLYFYTKDKKGGK